MHTVSKTCGRCQEVVSAGASVGDRCPHCGAYWGGERSYTTYDTSPSSSGGDPLDPRILFAIAAVLASATLPVALFYVSSWFWLVVCVLPAALSLLLLGSAAFYRHSGAERSERVAALIALALVVATVAGARLLSGRSFCSVLAPTVVRELDSDNAEARAAAVQQLATAKRDELSERAKRLAIERLDELRRSADAGSGQDDVLAIVEALAALGHQDAGPALVAALQSKNMSAREKAATALGNDRYAAVALAPLTSALSDPVAEVRTAAITSLSRHPDATDALLKLLEAPEAADRAAAARALRSRDDLRAVEPLLAAWKRERSGADMETAAATEMKEALLDLLEFTTSDKDGVDLRELLAPMLEDPFARVQAAYLIRQFQPDPDAASVPMHARAAWGDVEVQEGLTPLAVKERLWRNTRDVLRCDGRSRPAPLVQFKITWTITGNGRPNHVLASGPRIPEHRTVKFRTGSRGEMITSRGSAASCIMRRIRKSSFPAPTNGYDQQVSATLTLGGKYPVPSYLR